MSTLLTIYAFVGLVFFVVAFAATQFGRTFTSEKFNYSETLIQLVWLGILWPIGLGAVIYALLKPTKPK